MKRSLLLTLFVMIVAAPLLIGMGPGNERSLNSLEPRFVPLDPDDNSYCGIVIDNKVPLHIKNISFSGSTKIGGMRKETDDSISALDLSRVQKIIIKNPFFQSPHHSPSNEMVLFILSEITFLLPDMATKTEEYLIPHDIVFSAEEISTGVQKAWRLRDITSFSIDHASSGTTALEQELSHHDRLLEKAYYADQQKGLWGIIKRWLHGLSEAFKAFLNLD